MTSCGTWSCCIVNARTIRMRLRSVVGREREREREGEQNKERGEANQTLTITAGCLIPTERNK